MASRNQGKTSKNLKASKNPVKGAAILKGAESIFAKKGFHEATISEINLNLFLFGNQSIQKYNTKNRVKNNCLNISIFNCCYEEENKENLR